LLVEQMQAAGGTLGDITQRQGRNPGKIPPVLGYDVVGIITAVGPDTAGVICWAASGRSVIRLTRR
jgi:NADPH:quinone reductase-like Zn-dependent oxidoreductase